VAAKLAAPPIARVMASGLPATLRRVYVNDAARNAAPRFPRNAISNTKYSLWSFVPRNLLEQFRCARGCSARAALWWRHRVAPVASRRLLAAGR